MQVHHKGTTQFLIGKCSSENVSNDTNNSAVKLAKCNSESLVLVSDADGRWTKPRKS